MQSKIRFISLFVGIEYVAFVGFGNIPIFLQASLLYLSCLGILYWLISHDFKPKLFDRALIVLTGILSMYVAVTSNVLIQVFSHLSILGVIILYLTIYQYGKSHVYSGGTFLLSFLHLWGDSLSNLFKKSTFQSFFSLPDKKSLGVLKISKDVRTGLFMAVPLLIIFHMLFLGINNDYAEFMNIVLTRIWQIVAHFWLSIKYILHVLITGYLMYSLLIRPERHEGEQSHRQGPASISNITSLSTILLVMILLFSVFFFFQSKTVFLGLSHLSFKDLSLYTQQGFWELLIVCFIGYVLITFTIHSLESLTKNLQKAVLILGTFISQLFIVSIFTHHKLFVLEQIFGLKDQRVLSSVAVFLMSLTFVLLFLRLLHKISSTSIFKIQLISLVGAMVLLNMINLDLFIARTYPIRYEYEEEIYKDYSYLLGNSYDTYPEWSSLIQEAQQTGIPTPSNYYWGPYRALREPRIRGVRYTPKTYLRGRMDKLRYKYETRSDRSLISRMKFNLNEWRAYGYFVEHKTEFDTFYDFVENP